MPPFACPACSRPLSNSASHCTDCGWVVPSGSMPTDLPRAALATDVGVAISLAENRLPPGYEYLGELGRGGMGVVYKARQVSLDRVVALKMILTGAQASGEQVARFRTEAQAIARLQHPGIVTIYDVGDFAGLPFLSLEFCAGGGLDGKLRGKRMPATAAASLLGRLAVAVQAAHDAKVIHRDLKPANVLLTADGTPKINDFGLAKRLDVVGRTRTGDVMGTPSYMAPEQALGKKEIGPATDVWALGAILYECLTGRPPFVGESLMLTLQKVVSEEPPPLRALAPDVPHELEAIVLECLRKDPAARYARADALAKDLRRFLSGLTGQTPANQSQPASPPKPPEKAAAMAPAVRDEISIRKPPPGGANSQTAPDRLRGRPIRPWVLLGGALVLLLGYAAALLVPPFLSSQMQDSNEQQSKDRDDKKPYEQKTPTDDKGKGAADGNSKNPPDDKGKAPGDKDRKKDDDKDKERKVVEGPRDKRWENSIGMKFARIPKGKFTMGSPKTDTDRSNREVEHEVELTKDFYLGVYEVTQKQYRTVMGYNPSYFSNDGKGSDKGTYHDYNKPGGGKNKVEDKDTDTFPVENVSWEDAQEFLKILNEREKRTLAGWDYRLPTEAEWEYSCREGAGYQKYHFGDTISSKQANFGDSKLNRTEKVGSYPANKYGLHDMHGNVWEWCHDWYDEGYYSSSPKTDPMGALNGMYRVFRGGGWYYDAWTCRSAVRFRSSPEDRSNYLGFRVALVPTR